MVSTPTIAPTTGSHPAVRFDTVGMRYDQGPEILHNVTFDLPQGGFQFLTGASGAGKSSLMRLIYLAKRCSSGTISLFGRNTALLGREELPDMRRRIGVIFQDFRLLNHLTVFENIALPLRVAGQPRKSYSEDVMELINWVGLGEHTHSYPPTLSGGEQQRAAIARAVVAKPDLIIADEPTGNVDPAMAHRLLRLFVELNKLGAAVLIATHDHSLIRAMDAPVMELKNGTLFHGEAVS